MTLHIKILGGGCANCERLNQHAHAAVTQLSVDATFEKSGDYADYEKYGLLSTPGLVVNEKLVSAGRVPAVSQIVTLLTQELTGSQP